jgi:3-oxoacyl-[acyl-carrier protein] reductase
MKHALVTGGSGEIGAAICRRLARDGLHVIVHANRHAEKAEAVVAQIQQAGGSAEAVLFDVTEAIDLSKELEQNNLLIDCHFFELRNLKVSKDFSLRRNDKQGNYFVPSPKPIQVLVNNAGIHADAPMAGMQHTQWHKVIDVNLNGFFNVTQPLLLPMMSTRWGRIINISSISAILGNRGQANYAAAKAGLHGATKSLAQELASRGVTVNTVAPGIIASDLTENVFDEATIKKLVPMKRAGTPEEVAALVSFLASEEAGYISGQIIGINGAMPSS